VFCRGGPVLEAVPTSALFLISRGMFMLRRFAAGIVTLSLGLSVMGAGDQGAYHISQTYKIPGEGRWDYLIVDPATHHLFVPRSTHVQIINTADGTVIGDVADTSGVHGVALASEFKRGFASDGKTNTVTIFDTDTFKTIGAVPTGVGPDGIIYDPFTKRVFCMNGEEGSVSVIAGDADPAKPGVVTIPLDGKPEFAASDGAGHVYINLEDKAEIAVVDAKEIKVTAHWSLAPGEEPTGMAIDPQTHRLFVGCHNKLMFVVNADNGKIVTSFPMGPDVDACTFDPDQKLAFASCGDSTLTVIHEDDADHFTALPVVHTAKGARTMAMDLSTHILYMPSADFEPLVAGQKRPKMIPGTFKILELKQ
jgi:DNA-binding beta-propeller fold protein YncE